MWCVLTGPRRRSAGGQKVKVVIAAAMWNNPHVLVLDEPTNYLDRESLGALAGAIKDFGGGVIMITHNSGVPPLRAGLRPRVPHRCQEVARSSPHKMFASSGSLPVLRDFCCRPEALGS